MILAWLLDLVHFTNEISFGDIILVILGSLGTFSIWWWNSKYRAARPFSMEYSTREDHQPPYKKHLLITKHESTVRLRVYFKRSCALEKINVRPVELEYWEFKDWRISPKFRDVLSNKIAVIEIDDFETNATMHATGRKFTPEYDENKGCDGYYSSPLGCQRKTYLMLTLKILAHANCEGYISFEVLRGNTDRGNCQLKMTVRLDS